MPDDPRTAERPEAGEPQPPRRRASETRPPARPWYEQPRGYVFLTLALAALVGGGRKWLQRRRVNQLVDRMERGTATASEIEAASRHGRGALYELMASIDTERPAPVRLAAARALLELWARDELIGEEERAVCTRLYQVEWHARRRYPRALEGLIPFEVPYGLLGLAATGPGVHTDQLQWSWRIRNSPRASLEQFTAWQSVSEPARFAIGAADFLGANTVNLAFQARLRPHGLTSTWELDLPQVPFQFERDPRLEVAAILATPDSATAENLARSVQLVIEHGNDDPPVFTPIDAEFAIVGTPLLATRPLPVDLAHTIRLEIEGAEQPMPAGPCVQPASEPGGTGERCALALAEPQSRVVAAPGTRRVRALLEPNPHLGWSHPGIRSVWPEPIVTDWVDARIVRR